jgi:Ca2+-binding RTX toxin-like protein
MLSVEHPLTSGDAIRLSNNRIAENASFGKLIGTLSGKDGDGDAFVSFALGTNPDKMFRIVDGNLVVNSNARFDFETQSHYSVRIKATDDEGTTVQKTFMIAVADVREDPVGTRGNDNLHGDAKNNIIDGKLGNDKLTGGDGADTFVFGKDYGKDVILDFDRAEGDRIDLSNAAGIDGYRDLISHHVRDMGEDLRITASDGSILTIKDMDLNALSKSMFDF